MESKRETIPVALVNGVYFPSQRLRFKVNDPSKQIFNMKDGYYGIVSKRFQQDGKYETGQEEQQSLITTQSDSADSTSLPSHKFKDHYSVGVIVKIIDQQ